MTKYATTIIASLSFTAAAHAGLISGVSVVENSPTDGEPATKAIDGSGLPGDTPALSGSHSDDFPDHYTVLGATAILTLDLGDNYSLDHIQLWNGNEDPDRGFQNVEIYVSPTDSLGDLVKLDTAGAGLNAAGGANGSGDFYFPEASGDTFNYEGFALDTSGATNASLLDNVRLIKLIAVDNYGPADDLTALGEIQLGGTLVPEPSSLALLGLGGLMMLRRQRD